MLPRVAVAAPKPSRVGREAPAPLDVTDMQVGSHDVTDVNRREASATCHPLNGSDRWIGLKQDCPDADQHPPGLNLVRPNLSHALKHNSIVR